MSLSDDFDHQECKIGEEKMEETHIEQKGE